MTDAGVKSENWLDALRTYAQPKMALMLVLGFSAGLPFLLYFSTLSVRLQTSGVDVAIIGFFSWFGLSYSLKFLWAPLVDRLRPPVLADVFGQRRAWVFVAQIGVALGLIGLGFSDPATSLGAAALFSFLTAFSSATQDVGIDAWRIEAAASDDEQAALAAAYQYGYKGGMLAAGGLALVLAGIVNWAFAYISMAALIALAATILLLWRRPGDTAALGVRLAAILPGLAFAGVFFGVVVVAGAAVGAGVPRLLDALGVELSRGDIRNIAIWAAASPFILCAALIPYIRSLKADHPRLSHPATGPFFDFFWRYGWSALVMLAFIASYRLSDIVMGVMAKASYSHIGYSATDIGLVSGSYGPLITFVGVALAGLAALRFGLTVALIAGAVVSVLGNLTFVWLMGQSSDSLTPLFFAISADNIAGGFAGTVFVAFMSKLTSRAFTASQYALFSSMFTLAPKLLAGASGVIISSVGYAGFFLYAAALGIPAILLSFVVERIQPTRAPD